MNPVEVPQKLYYRIGEAARIVGVKPHVIRFWEREFKAVRPKKSATNQRIFSRKDVEKLVLIRALLHEQRFTIEGARKHLRDHGYEKLETPAAEASRPDELRHGLLDVRMRLAELLDAMDHG